LQPLVEIVDTITQDVRSISHSLLPPLLIDFGLEAALNHLCALSSASGQVKVDFYTIENEVRLDAAIELNLYRIAQELLNNALKYSKASNIVIQLFSHTDNVTLMVEDDGMGFDKNELKNNLKGIGIQDVQARVKSLEGFFSLESNPGQGVLATVEIPLKKPTYIAL
jgi:signal transduction histidine kinase